MPLWNLFLRHWEHRAPRADRARGAATYVAGADA